MKNTLLFVIFFGVLSSVQAGDAISQADKSVVRVVIKNNEGLLMLGGRLFIDVATYPDGIESEVNVYKGGIFATNFIANEKSIDTVIMVS